MWSAFFTAPPERNSSRNRWRQAEGQGLRRQHQASPATGTHSNSDSAQRAANRKTQSLHSDSSFVAFRHSDCALRKLVRNVTSQRPNKGNLLSVVFHPAQATIDHNNRRPWAEKRNTLDQPSSAPTNQGAVATRRASLRSARWHDGWSGEKIPQHQTAAERPKSLLLVGNIHCRKQSTTTS